MMNDQPTDELTTAFIGCYTTDECPFGLRTVACDPASGALRLLGSYAVPNAIYQALTPDGRFLLSCADGALEAFRVDAAALVRTDRLALGTPSVCHVSVMPDGSRICWADYLAPEAGSVGFRDGRFLPTSLVRHRHAGSGPNLPRQAAAHCHQAVPLPDGSGYAVVDLGQDRIFTYPAGTSVATLPPGAGPRHLVFHPNGRHVLLVSELANLVSSYRREADGALTLVAQRSLLSEDWRGASIAAAIRLSDDGRRVFASTRGHDSISTFDFDPTSGDLAPVATTKMPGQRPRDFAFLPGTDLALVALETSGTVVSLRYDARTGGFTPLAELAGFHRPVAVTWQLLPKQKGIQQQ